MAQKVVLIDDLDGSEGDETLRYTADGQEYEVDLSNENAKKFRELLTPYITKSRKIEPQPVIPAPTRSTHRRRGGTGSGRNDLTEVRAWAKAQGIEVSPRGRIKQETLERYDREHSRARTAPAGSQSA